MGIKFINKYISNGLNVLNIWRNVVSYLLRTNLYSEIPKLGTFFKYSYIFYWHPFQDLYNLKNKILKMRNLISWELARILKNWSKLYHTPPLKFKSLIIIPKYRVFEYSKFYLKFILLNFLPLENLMLKIMINNFTKIPHTVLSLK